MVAPELLAPELRPLYQSLGDLIDMVGPFLDPEIPSPENHKEVNEPRKNRNVMYEAFRMLLAVQRSLPEARADASGNYSIELK